MNHIAAYDKYVDALAHAMSTGMGYPRAAMTEEDRADAAQLAQWQEEKRQKEMLPNYRPSILPDLTHD